MDAWNNFVSNLNLTQVIGLAIRAAAVLLCLTIHELCHGLAAKALGDDTASRQGRLSLNPLRHLDVFGTIMMLVAGVGWAKPVPVDPRQFKNPKWGMAITALAGPVSNFVLAFAALLLGRGLLYLALIEEARTIAELLIWGVIFLARVALLSVGLGLFNLIPIPPLDGSRVLFALLPDRLYFKVMRYERYIMIVLFILLWMGLFSTPLNRAIQWVLRGMCGLTGFPVSVFGF